MHHALIPHPISRSETIARIEADPERTGTAIHLRYLAAGKIGDLLLPRAVSPARANELWRHTCFEAFVATGAGAYYEFNFSPSTEWAAYRFTGHREGRTNAAIDPPRIRAHKADASYELTAELDLSRLDLPKDRPWRLGLSAVIEEANGRKSYWALAHPSGDPDFHHSVCFAAELPAA